jgi:hypothetical protein
MQLLAWRQWESCTTIEKTMEMKCRHPDINTFDLITYVRTLCSHFILEKEKEKEKEKERAKHTHDCHKSLDSRASSIDHHHQASSIKSSSIDHHHQASSITHPASWIKNINNQKRTIENEGSSMGSMRTGTKFRRLTH